MEVSGYFAPGNLTAILISQANQPYHPGMAYIPDDIFQIPDNHLGYTPASEGERERLTFLLLKRLDQEQQVGLSRQDRERPAVMHKQIRVDLAATRYEATEKTVGDIEHTDTGKGIFGAHEHEL